MRTSANAIGTIVRQSDLDRADDLMDQINEAMDQVQEMNEVMSQPIGSAMDEGELEAELAELEEIGLDAFPSTENLPRQKIPSQKPIINLPNVPENKIVVRGQTEEDELAELEQAMN